MLRLEPTPNLSEFELTPEERALGAVAPVPRAMDYGPVPPRPQVPNINLPEFRSDNFYIVSDLDLMDNTELISYINTINAGAANPNLVIPAERNFCVSLNNPNTRVPVKGKIGQGENAEVYQIIFENNINAALKLIPIIDNGSRGKNKYEIDLMLRLSNEVIQGKSNNFPLVLARGQCGYASFQDCRFQRAAHNYACYLTLKNRYEALTGNLAERGIINLANFPARESLFLQWIFDSYGYDSDYQAILTYFYNIVKNRFPDYVYPLQDFNCDQVGAGADFVIFELASCSIKTYLIQNLGQVERDDWIRIIGETLKGIGFLHSLNYSHNHIHLGNVLLSIRQNTVTKVMLCDFGSVTALTNENRDHDSLDLYTQISPIAPFDITGLFNPYVKFN